MKIGNPRRAISEMLGAVILIMITLLAFGFITYAFYSQTTVSTTNLAQQYKNGQIKAGQLLSMVYHTETADTVQIAIDNFGFYPITPKQVYITQQGFNGGSGIGLPAELWTGAPQLRCFDIATGNLGPQYCTNGAIGPKQIAVITVQITGTGWSATQQYDLFLYTNTHEGYDWSL